MKYPSTSFGLRKIYSLAKKIFFGGFNPLLWIASIVSILSWKPFGHPNPDIINLYLGIMILIFISLQTLFNSFVKSSRLQKDLRLFIISIITIIFIIVFIFVIVWATWLRIYHPSYMTTSQFLSNTIIFIVSFIPQGIPVCLTLSLLIISKKMKKSHILIKCPSMIESLNSLDMILFNKGLTQNRMFVASASIGSEELDDKKRSKGFEQLIASCLLCNDARFNEQDKNSSINEKEAFGSPTDIGLLRFFTQYERFTINEKYTSLAEVEINQCKVKLVKSLDPEVNCKVFDTTNEEFILLKGPSDYLIKKCKTVIKKSGHEINLKDLMDKVIELQDKWSSKGQRVIAVCKRKVSYEYLTKVTNFDLENFIDETNDFCLIGLVGLIDPLREGVSNIIADIKETGIRVFMVTDDYSVTAASIANEIGIFTQPVYDCFETMKRRVKLNDGSEKVSLMLTGKETESLEDEDWKAVMDYKEIVLSRVSLDQKLRVIKEFKLKNKVGVFGSDDVDTADVTMSLDKDSITSQIIFHDLPSILFAFKTAGLMFKNLRKVICFLLPSSFTILVPVLMSMFFGIPQNLSSLGMLVVSLVIDTGCSMALMMEKEENGSTRSSRLVDSKLITQAVVLGLVSVVSSQSMFFIYMYFYTGLTPKDIFYSFGGSTTVVSRDLTIKKSLDEHYLKGQTVVFVSIVVFQLFGGLLSTRTNRISILKFWNKRTRNLCLIVAQFLGYGIMSLVVYTPFMHSLFNSRPIPVQFLFLPLIFAFGVFGLDEARKFMVRRKFLFLNKIAW